MIDFIESYLNKKFHSNRCEDHCEEFNYWVYSQV